MSANDWMDDAACASVPNFTELRTLNQKQHCTNCPVVKQCLRAGLAFDAEYADAIPAGNTALYGYPVYGGLTIIERLALVAETETAA